MLADTGVKDIADGLVLLEGANGAGKSTFLEFLTSMLFGYATGRGSNKYSDTPGGLRGGVASLQTKDGRLVRWERGTVPPASGSLSVLHEGTAVDPFGWLGSASRDLYGSVFALGIDELRDGALGADRQAAIEAAITGMGVRGLPAALKSTENEAKALDKKLKAIQEELDTATRELDSAKARTRLYDEALDSARAARDSIAALKTPFDDAHSEALRLGRMAKAWNTWCEFEQTRAKLSQLDRPTNLDDGSLERLRNARITETRLTNETKAATAELDEVTALLARLPINEGLTALASEIESLAATVHSVREAELGLEDRERSLKDAKRDLQSSMLLLGTDWDEARLADVDTSLVAHNEGSKLARSLTDLAQEVSKLSGLSTERSRDWSDAKELVEKQQIAINAGSAGPTVAEVDRQSDLVEQIRSLLSKADIAKSELSSLEGNKNPDAEADPAPTRRLLLIGAFVGTAILLVAIATKLYPLAALGPIAAVLIPLLFKPRPNANGASTQPRINHLRAELERLRSEIERLAAHENWTVTSTDDLLAIQRQLRKARDAAAQRDSDEKRLDDAIAIAERLLKLKSQAESDIGRTQETLNVTTLRWHTWCAERGYPRDLDHQSLPEFENRIDSTRRAVASVNKASEDRDQYVDRLAKAKNQVDLLKSRLGEPVSLGSTADAIADLDRRLKVAQAAQRDAHEATKQIATLKRKLGSLEEELNTVEADIQHLHASAQVDSDPQFADAYESSREAIRVGQQHDQAKALLVQISGPGEGFDNLCRDLSSVTDGLTLPAQAQESDDLLCQLRDQLREAEDEALKLDRDLKNLEEGADLGTALSRRAELQAELDAIRRRWLETTLAKLMLNEAKEQFQNKVQDGVFERASHYMRQLTDGVSEAIRKDGDSYYVLDRDGTRRSVSQLNRSHAERLLLCVRLGYIDNYCENREPLPIVLDDVLVNFDPKHQALAVRTIVELAERHQVIYLTCHPSTRELFASQTESFQLVRLSKWRFEGI